MDSKKLGIKQGQTNKTISMMNIYENLVKIMIIFSSPIYSNFKIPEGNF